MIIPCITLALAFGESVVVAITKGEGKASRVASGLHSFSSK